MTFWTPAHLAAVTGGRWLARPEEPELALHGLSIDSRTIRRGEAFLAVKGDRFDGHDFAPQAVAAGAAVAIVGRDISDGLAWPAPAALLLVDEPIAALHRLARAYRNVLREHGVKVIAVTGSNGKTTTRHLIHAVLSARYKGTQSPKSFNNHIGVPVTMLSAAPDHDFVVAEIGTNHPGEVADLADIVRPDAAVVTSISEEHLEFFGTLEDVAKEETSVLSFIEPRGFAAVENGAFAESRPFIDCADGVRLVRYGIGTFNDQLDLWLGDCRDVWGDEGWIWGQRFTLGRVEFSVPLIGRHNAVNVLAAIAMGRWMGVGDGAAAQALIRVEPPPMRMQIQRFGRDPGITLINDAYNANPCSVASAVGALGRIRWGEQASRRVAILGDMLELGDTGPQHHRRFGRFLAPSWQVDLLVLIGPLSATYGIESPAGSDPPGQVRAFAQWTDDLPQRVAALLEPGDVVLLKASRGMRLERLVPAIAGRFGGPPPTGSGLPTRSGPTADRPHGACGPR